MMKDTFEQCRDMGGEFRDCKVMSSFEQPEGKCRIQQQDDAMMVDEVCLVSLWPVLLSCRSTQR